MIVLSPIDAMKLAIAEAKKGLGHVAPNPPVGCVILDKNNKLIAKGYHKKYGQAHAEIDALNQIQDMSVLEDATCYVTLEPCAHEGKTGSCAKRLAELPISRVVYGLKDPFSLVNGKGAEILKAKNIEAVQWCDLKIHQQNDIEIELEELAEIFLWNHRQKKTFVSLKLATSLDGMLGLSDGSSHWLTNEKSNSFSHFLRSQHDAVMVGKKTIIADNPELSVRHPEFPDNKNKVVILDSKGVLINKIEKLNVAKSRELSDIYVFVDQNIPINNYKNLNVIPVNRDDSGQLDLSTVLNQLYKLKIYSIYVEGGAELASSFISNKLFQRYHQLMAPTWLGAHSGLSITKNYNLTHWNDKYSLSDLRVEKLDDNIYLTARLRY